MKNDVDLYTGRPRSLAVSWGDPAGIGPEIILKSFTALPRVARSRITVFGDIGYMRALARMMKLNVPILDAKKAAPDDDGLRVENICSLKFSGSDFGKIRKRFGQVAMLSVERAADAVADGEYGALVTAPINKGSVNRAGYKIAGHTEFLADRFGGVKVAMMLASKKLKVVVATTHLALADAPGKLETKSLVGLLRLIDRAMKNLNLQAPRIAVCGLNPHAGDGGLFGDEEKMIIEPAIRSARRAGVNAGGPYPADTMFTAGWLKKYDVALAMYHDQGLIPVKVLSFGNTVNITLGLPFPRLSVDHGTAFDIAGKNMADAGPMIFTIKTAFKVLSGKFI